MKNDDDDSWHFLACMTRLDQRNIEYSLPHSCAEKLLGKIDSMSLTCFTWEDERRMTVSAAWV